MKTLIYNILLNNKVVEFVETVQMVFIIGHSPAKTRDNRHSNFIPKPANLAFLQGLFPFVKSPYAQRAFKYFSLSNFEEFANTVV